MTRLLHSILDSRLRIVVLVALVLRFSLWLFMTDHSSLRAMEYGVIADNIIHDKGYGYFWKDSSRLRSDVPPSSVMPQPSAYMMPGYTCFIATLLTIESPLLRSLLLVLLQTSASLISIVLAWHWLRRLHSERLALIVCWCIAVLPEFVYASTLAASVNFVQVLSLALCSVGSWYRQARTQRFLLMLCSAALLSIRAEAALFLLALSVAYLMHASTRERSLWIACGCLVVLVPWTVRNAIVFDAFVPLTTSGGLNFYRGHNPYALGTWSDARIDDAVQQLPFDRQIELRLDSLYKAEAMQAISGRASQELEGTVLKLVQLYVYDSNDARSGNALYWIPSVLIGVSALIGLFFIRGLRPRFGRETLLYIAVSSLTTMMFFCLPRYQSMLRIMLLPYAAALWLLPLDARRRRKSTP